MFKYALTLIAISLNLNIVCLQNSPEKQRQSPEEIASFFVNISNMAQRLSAGLTDLEESNFCQTYQQFMTRRSWFDKISTEEITSDLESCNGTIDSIQQLRDLINAQNPLLKQKDLSETPVATQELRAKITAQWDADLTRMQNHLDTLTATQRLFQAELARRGNGGA